MFLIKNKRNSRTIFSALNTFTFKAVFMLRLPRVRKWLTQLNFDWRSLPAIDVIIKYYTETMKSFILRKVLKKTMHQVSSFFLIVILASLHYNFWFILQYLASRSSSETNWDIRVYIAIGLHIGRVFTVFYCTCCWDLDYESSYFLYIRFIESWAENVSKSKSDNKSTSFKNCITWNGGSWKIRYYQLFLLNNNALEF